MSEGLARDSREIWVMKGPNPAGAANLPGHYETSCTTSPPFRASRAVYSPMTRNMSRIIFHTPFTPLPRSGRGRGPLRSNGRVRGNQKLREISAGRPCPLRAFAGANATSPAARARKKDAPIHISPAKRARMACEEIQARSKDRQSPCGNASPLRPCRIPWRRQSPHGRSTLPAGLAKQQPAVEGWQQ